MARSRIVETGTLDARKAAILRAVAREHIRTGEPVGSQAIVERYALGVKPATVRNEMAAMTEYGYLAQPHTSAGRVPTTRVYRYYVEHLMSGATMLRIESYFKRLPEPGESLTELLQATLQILARAAQSVAFATTARDETMRVLRCVLTPCSPRRVVSVVVMEHGEVDNRLIDLQHVHAQRALNRIHSVLTTMIEGQTVRAVLRHDPPHALPMESPAERAILASLLRAIQQQVQEIAEGELLYDGTAYLLRLPEFQREVRQLEAVLRVLEARKPLYRLLQQEGNAELHITIGEENSIDVLRCCTLVYACYHAGGRPAGVIGLIAPVRMDYDQVLPTVRHAAHALSDLLTRTLYS